MQKDDLSDVTICEKCILFSWLLVTDHLQSSSQCNFGQNTADFIHYHVNACNIELLLKATVQDAGTQ